MPETAVRKITMEEYREIAEKEWGKLPKRGNGKKQCPECLSEARRRGNANNAPLLPPRYEGNCPRCGGELRNVSPF